MNTGQLAYVRTRLRCKLAYNLSIPEDVLGKTNWRQGNVQTYDVLFGEWLCTAPDFAMDNSLPKLATNEGRKTDTTIGFYS